MCLSENRLCQTRPVTWAALASGSCMGRFGAHICFAALLGCASFSRNNNQWGCGVYLAFFESAYIALRGCGRSVAELYYGYIFGTCLDLPRGPPLRSVTVSSPRPPLCVCPTLDNRALSGVFRNDVNTALFPALPAWRRTAEGSRFQRSRDGMVAAVSRLRLRSGVVFPLWE